MQYVMRANKLKVIHQRSIATDGGRAHARTIRNQISVLNLGQQSLQSTHEGRLVERPVKFSGAATPVFCSHVPESGIRERGNRVLQIEVRSPITFSLERQHRVRSGIHAAADTAREVHPQKWET